MHLIRLKQEEIDKFNKQATEYSTTKKEEIKQARQEMVELFEIIKRQCETIDQVESGAFSGGIKSFNIPK